MVVHGTREQRDEPGAPLGEDEPDAVAGTWRGLGPQECRHGSVKLNAARRVLGVKTETEAIDVALDLVVFRRELVRGIAAVRGAGGIEDVFEKRHP